MIYVQYILKIFLQLFYVLRVILFYLKLNRLNNKMWQRVTNKNEF